MATGRSGAGTAAAGTPAGDPLLRQLIGTDCLDRPEWSHPSGLSSLSGEIICWDATAGTLVGTWTCTTRAAVGFDFFLGELSQSE